MFKKKSDLNLEYSEGSFLFNKIEYNYSNVKSISYAQGRSDIHVIAHGTESSYGAMLVIDMNDGEVVTIREKTTSGRKEIVEKIRNFYIEISYSTYLKRINTYHDEVKEKGYFSYNNWRFYPEGKYIHATIINKKFEFKKYKLTKNSEGDVYVKLKNPSTMQKIKRQLSFRGVPAFSSARDQDIIFVLLKHYFNLSWSKK